MTAWSDTELAAMGGYLIAWDSRFRQVPQLDVVARDCFRVGVRIAWGCPPYGRRGYAYMWRRVIVLAYPLFECEEPGLIVETVAHELGHIVTFNRSDDVARGWACRRYGDLIVPVVA